MPVKDKGRLSDDTPGNNQENKDLLHGAAAIADFINEISDTPMSRSKVYRLIESKEIPAGRLGPRLLVGSKKRIRERLERLTGGG
jgi:predicted DNA-binding transcriptional regulator AlpA